MVKAVIMPKLGQSEETVTIVRWRKQVGDTVAKGDVLFEIETDKALLEVESFYEGTLLKIVASEGVTVPVQTTVAFVGDPGEPVPEVAPPPVRSPRSGVGSWHTSLRQIAPPPPEPEIIGMRRRHITAKTGAQPNLPSAPSPPSVVRTAIFQDQSPRREIGKRVRY